MWRIDMAKGQRVPVAPMAEDRLGNILDEFIVKNVMQFDKREKILYYQMH